MDIKVKDVLYVYGIENDEFSKSIQGVYNNANEIYLKSNNDKVICEVLDYFIYNNRTILRCQYNVVDKTIPFEVPIDICIGKNVLDRVYFKYIIDEDDTDEFDIVPDDLFFESEKSETILKSNVSNELFKHIRILCSSPWCYANIGDNDIKITVEENPFGVERKCFMEFYVNYNDYNHKDVVVITQKGKIYK